MLAFYTSVAITGVLAIILAIMPKNVLKVNSIVRYGEKEVTLEFNASNLSSGSGTVTLNGNLFTYQNLTVSGDTITFGSGSRIYANENSGSSVGANGLKGGGFLNVKFTGGNGGTASSELNGNPINIEVASGGMSVEHLESNAFDLSISSGSLNLLKMELTYGCVYNQDPATQKVLFVGSDNMSYSNWSTSYMEMLDAVEGVTAECDEFSTGTFSFLQIGNLDTDHAGKATEFRAKLTSDSWDAVFFQLSRRLTPSSTELNNAEYEMFRDVIIPLTKEVTNNITLLAMEGTSNPTIFSYNSENGQPASTGNKETMTADEDADFLDNLALNWATNLDIKVARYGKVFQYCETVGSIEATRNNAKAYSRGLMAYATIDETPIPQGIATTWVSTVFPSTSSSAKTIKNNLGAKVNELIFA